MAEIVKLGQARKARAKAAAARAAAENRVRHGRTKAEKQRDAREDARRAALLDGVRRDDDGEREGR